MPRLFSISRLRAQRHFAFDGFSPFFACSAFSFRSYVTTRRHATPLPFFFRLSAPTITLDYRRRYYAAAMISHY